MLAEFTNNIIWSGFISVGKFIVKQIHFILDLMLVSHVISRISIQTSQFFSPHSYLSPLPYFTDSGCIITILRFPSLSFWLLPPPNALLELKLANVIVDEMSPGKKPLQSQGMTFSFHRNFCLILVQCLKQKFPIFPLMPSVLQMLKVGGLFAHRFLNHSQERQCLAFLLPISSSYFRHLLPNITIISFFAGLLNTKFPIPVFFKMMASTFQSYYKMALYCM